MYYPNGSRIYKKNFDKWLRSIKIKQYEDLYKKESTAPKLTLPNWPQKKLPSPLVPPVTLPYAPINRSEQTQQNLPLPSAPPVTLPYAPINRFEQTQQNLPLPSAPPVTLPFQYGLNTAHIPNPNPSVESIRGGRRRRRVKKSVKRRASKKSRRTRRRN